MTLLIVYIVFGAIGAWLAAWLAGIDFKQTMTTRELVIVQGGGYAGQAMIVVAWLRLVERRDESPRIVAAGLGVIAVIATVPIVYGAASIARWMIEIARGVETDPIAHAVLEQMSTAPRDAWFVAQCLLVTLGAGVIEEVAYRGCLQRGLRSMGIGPWTAISITSALFTAQHIGVAEAHALAGLLALSLGLGWAMERSGRLTAPIVMHVLFNAGNLAAMLATT